jgi:hypothetical protein
MLYYFCTITVCIKVYLQLIAQLGLMLLHVSAVNYSHPQTATSVEDISAIHAVKDKW